MSRPSLQEMLRGVFQAEGNDTKWKSGFMQRNESTGSVNM